MAIASFALAFTWGELSVAPAPFNPDGAILLPAADDPQPDTLQYDGNQPGILLYGSNNLWTEQRFTPPVEFELRSVYVLPLNSSNNTTDPCTVAVAEDNNGFPGTILTYMIVPTPIPSAYNWIDVNLPSPIIFDQGEDFHLMYSSPGGPYPGTGWWPYFDNDGVNNGRTYYSNSYSGPSWTSVPYDAMIRAGGELGGAFLDLATVSVFNDEQQFFFEAGDEITFKAVVENVGLEDADTYTYEWEVKDMSGTSVWTYAGVYTDLLAGQEVELTADETWTPTQDGYYDCWGTVTHPNDADPSNDDDALDVGVFGLDAWYYYDDGDGTVNFSFSAGDEIGVSLAPAALLSADEYIQIDSIKVNLNTAGDCQFKVYQGDGAGGQPGTLMWTSTTQTMASGWNTIAVGEDASVFEGSAIVCVVPQEDITIVMDDEIPTAGTNPDMPTTHWSNEGGWGDWNSGDLLLRAYITESTATPPGPIIELSADTVYFPDTYFGETSYYTLTISNGGSENNLQINTMSLQQSVDVFALPPLSYPLVIGPLSSEDIELSFSPIETDDQDFSGMLGILHNAGPTTLVPIYGTGLTLSAFQRGDETPGAYVLLQNHPNPFNPTTSIGFALPNAQEVELVVYNVMGEAVATLVDGEMGAGYHFVDFTGENLTSGIYFYRLTAGDYTEMKKMILMK